MRPWNNTQRQWKRTADDAVGVGRYGAERERLAAEVAKRIWVAHGGRDWAEACVEGSLVVLETLITPHLNDVVVRSALGLRYLGALRESVRTADYEDGRRLAAETRWAEGYLEGEVHCPLLAIESDGSKSALRPSADVLLERLQAALAARVTADLKTAVIAA